MFQLQFYTTCVPAKGFGELLDDSEVEQLCKFRELHYQFRRSRSLFRGRIEPGIVKQTHLVGHITMDSTYAVALQP